MTIQANIANAHPVEIRSSGYLAVERTSVLSRTGGPSHPSTLG